MKYGFPKTLTGRLASKEAGWHSFSRQILIKDLSREKGKDAYSRADKNSIIKPYFVSCSLSKGHCNLWCVKVAGFAV